VLGELQLSIDRVQFATWLKDTDGVDMTDDAITVGVPNDFILRWLEGHLSEAIERTVLALAGRAMAVGYTVTGTAPVVAATPPAEEAAPAVAPAPRPATGSGARFHPRYTLDTFIVGPGNRLAYTAARSVADRPATIYNPLFLYGGVGLGKTHLLHGVGHIAQSQGLSVLYASCEQFVNELINAIREQRTEDFRQKWRSADLLLIDDVQFISGKEQTQEEFFHTFNDLYSQHRQIILTSDRSPKYLPGIEDRLRSRFEWGLTADIQPPDLETRTAILQAKAREQGVPLPAEVASLIARRALENIRELEGHLNRVVAFHQLTQQPITVDLVNVALEGITPARRNLPQPQAVIDAVVKLFRVAPEDLSGPRREQKLAYARHLAMYLLYEDCRRSLAEIGRLLGGRDHTTILHGHTKIAGLVNTSSSVRQDIADLRKLLS